MIKRFFDIVVSLLGLIFFLPILLLISILIWKYDKKFPFYISARVGKNNILFNTIKFRTMIVDAEKTGIVSTSNKDLRITPIGHKIRKYKLDELTQLWNVLVGDMSLVGPRPNVKTETDLYTNIEKKLLSARPGITDFSSIVFSDEGDILEGSDDPDLKYNQIIRPWKSRLALIYIDNRTLMIDIKIIIWTVLGVFSKKYVLKNITNLLISFKSDNLLIEVCKRLEEPIAFHPPGFNKIINKRS